MAKVSVIVPIYNAEKYLEQCLDSIVNQTLKDIEIILIDDLANGTEVETYKSEYGTLTAKAINPTELT